MFAVAVLGACAAALFAAAGVAYAAFPGENGKMAFTKGVRSTGFVDEIYAMNPYGTRLERLTHNSAYDYDPAWSPNGKRIAFSSNRRLAEGSAATEVYVMNADGSGVRRVTDAPGDNWNPTWSPSGARIAFQTNRNVTDADPLNTDIYSVRLDGTGEKRLTSNTSSDLQPDWSADGRRIAFYSTRYENPADVGEGSDIFVMNADGSGVRRVTATPGYDENPDWSPDGTRIAFTNDFLNIYTVNANGTGLQNLTRLSATTEEHSREPCWSPDGTMIAFGGRRIVGFDEDSNEPVFGGGIYSINPNGGREKRVQGTGAFGGTQGLDWQPLP
jgi:Tol biopolymer transport system component